MHRALRTLLPLLAAPLLLAPAPAAAKPVRNLWATVNRCDTAAWPNTVGIRASMPGTPSRQRLYMHFRIQYWSETRQSFVESGASTRWLRVGGGRAAATQSGFNFPFADPPEGEQFVLRGVVRFRYTARRKRNGKRRWVIVKRYERMTRNYRPGVEGSDPPGASFALCIIRRGIGEGHL